MVTQQLCIVHTSESILTHVGVLLLICSRGEKDCENAVSELKAKISTDGTDTTPFITWVACDISTEEGRKILVDKTKEIFGTTLHGLVNNVGVNIRKNVLEQTNEEYDQTLRTNMDSAYFLCRQFHAMLLEGAKSTKLGGSSVVNVASVAGVQSSGTGCAYGLSKAAMIHFSRALACEWAKYNIRVNAVAPWQTMTPMLKDAIQANPGQSLEKAKFWTPMHRLAEPEEIASPIVFLLMPCASYVTGQCLAIDGGLTAQGFDGPCVTDM